jgi:hypothetical protein
VTPSGIEPATFRFVAQFLNHYATACPKFDPRTVRPLESRYTDWATLPTCFHSVGVYSCGGWQVYSRLEVGWPTMCRCKQIVSIRSVIIYEVWRGGWWYCHQHSRMDSEPVNIKFKRWSVWLHYDFVLVTDVNVLLQIRWDCHEL